MNTLQHQNTGSSLNEASGLQLLEITLSGIKIGKQYIQDVEIIYDGTFEIKGHFTINDIYDLETQGFKKPQNIVNIKLIDQHKDNWDRDFMILRTTETKMQDSRGIKFYIQDIASWRLKNTFIPKSWEETKLVDVFNYILSLEVKPLIPKIKIIEKPGRTLKHFCTPLNQNFLDFITDEFRKEGTYFYQTKDSIIIGEIEIPETPQFPYKQTGAPALYGFNIMEYTLKFNNILKTNSILPKTHFLAYNPETKKVKEYTKSLEDYKDDMKLTPKVYNSQMTNYNRHSTQEYILDTTKYKHLCYKDNTEITIFVPGNIKYSILYKKIDIYLSGAVYADDTRNTGDYKLSGKYMIQKVTDKIVLGQKFYQKIVAKRVSEGIKN